MRSTKSLILGAAGVAVLVLVVMLLLKLSSDPEPTLDDDQIAQAQRHYQRVQAAQARRQIEPVSDTAPRPPRVKPAPRKRPPQPDESRTRARLAPKPLPVKQLRPLQPDEGAKDLGTVKEQMDGANRLYDRADYEGAREEALRILGQSPGERRMLRIVVSSSCIMGDHDMAEEYFGQLPSDRDRRQMARRCSRYGVDLE